MSPASPGCHWENTTLVTKQGVDLCAPTHDHVTRFWWELYASWEPEMFEAFAKYVHAHTVVLDVGAFIGATTAYLAARSALVVGLEPTGAFQNLKKAIRLNGLERRARLLNAALGPADGFVYFTGKADSMDYQVGLVEVDDRDSFLRLGELYPRVPLPGACFAAGHDPGLAHELFGEDSLSNFDLRLHAVDEDHPWGPPRPSACLFSLRSGKIFVFLDLRHRVMVEFMSVLWSGSLDRGLASSVRAARQALHRGRFLVRAPMLSVARLLHMVPELEHVGFIKIDTEGAEAGLVEELRPLIVRARPVLWVSIHVQFIGLQAANATLAALHDIFPLVAGPFPKSLTGTIRPFPRGRLTDWATCNIDVLCLWRHPARRV